MKKLSLMLALILVLTTGALCSCGANSSPEKAALAALDAMYDDFDYEDFEKVCLDCNEEVLKEYLGKKDFENFEDRADQYKDSYKDAIKSIEKSIDNIKEDDGKIKISFDVVACDVYGEKDDRFDSLINNFTYKSTDLEDVVDKVAVVQVLMLVEEEDDEGNERTEADVLTFRCYRVDGDWMIDGFPGL